MKTQKIDTDIGGYVNNGKGERETDRPWWLVKQGGDTDRGGYVDKGERYIPWWLCGQRGEIQTLVAM